MKSFTEIICLQYLRQGLSFHGRHCIIKFFCTVDCEKICAVKVTKKYVCTQPCLLNTKVVFSYFCNFDCISLFAVDCTYT